MSGRGTLVTLAVLVGLTAFLGAATPRVVQTVEDDALASALKGGGAFERGITVTPLGVSTSPDSQSYVAPEPSALATVRDGLRDNLGPTLRNAVGTATYSAASGPYDTVPPLTGPDGNGAMVDLRFQDGYASHVRFVAGRAPDVSAEPGTFEVALSRRSADALRLRAGDAFVLSGPVTGQGVAGQGVAGGRKPVTMVVSGLYDPLDGRAGFWDAEPAMVSPQVRLRPGSADEPILVDAVSAVIAPQALGALMRTDEQILTGDRPGAAWRFQLDPDRVTGDAVDALEREASAFATQASLVAPVRVSTGLPDLLAAYRAQRTTARAVVTLALSGLLLIALAVLALAARLGIQRRETTLALLRARGGSLAQVCGLLAAEAAVVAVPVASVAAALAVLLVPGRAVAAPVGLAAGVAAAAVAVAPFLAARTHRRIGRVSRRDLVRRRPSPRQLTVEVLVVAVAAVAVAELRQRGLSPAPGFGVDPLLGSVPVLVGLAVALAALRLYPVPLRVLGRASARRRDAVPFLGLARAGRESPVTALPLVVLLLALSLAVFADTTRTTVRQGQQLAAWQRTGADAQVEGYGGLPLTSEQVRRAEGLPGVRSAVRAFASDASTLYLPGAPEALRVVAVDVPGYTTVLRGSPLRFRFPAAMSAPVPRGGVIPALVTDQLAPRAAGTLNLDLNGSTVQVGVVGSAHGLPVAGSGDVVVLPLAALNASVGVRYDTNLLYLTGPGARAEPLRAAVAGTAMPPVIRVRSDVYGRVHDAPLVRGTLLAFLVGSAVGLGYCLVAVRLALLVTAGPRERMLSYLRTLGLSRRQARRLAVAELAPTVLVAAVVGVPLGVALLYLVAPAIDLGPFTGSSQDPGIQVDPVTLAAVTVGLVLVVLAALMVETAHGARRRLGAVLRVGEEE